MSTTAARSLAFGPETLDDLMRVQGKAELIAGRIVHQVSSGFKPNRVAFQIALRLEIYSTDRGVGFALTDGIGFALHPCLANGRQSFSPDAAYYDGPLPDNERRFISGTPNFAAEVRSENDDGPVAEAAQASKRADYFEAGTLVVGDVDPEARVVASFATDPTTPVAIFRPGDIATAEPALPGWRVAVDGIFAIQ